MEERKISSTDEVQARIEAKLLETQSAQQGPELPKGTTIEDEMIKAAAPPVEIVAPETDSEKNSEKKSRGRGRPSGSGKGKYKSRKVTKEKKPNGETTETVTEVEHEDPPVEKSDFFAMIINNSLLPLAAHFLKKDVEHLKITEAQSKESVKYMPEEVIIKPSWGAYIGFSLLAVIGNVAAAPTRTRETAEMIELKKALAKSIDVEKLRVEIAELQRKHEAISSKLNGAKVETVHAEPSTWSESKAFVVSN